MSWMAPTEDSESPVTGYFIEKCDLNMLNCWIKVARVDYDVRSLKIMNLIEGHEYMIRVYAENEHGKSLPLESDKFKPLRIYGRLFFIGNCCFIGKLRC